MPKLSRVRLFVAMMVIGAACAKEASLEDQCRDQAAGEGDAIAEQCKCDVADGVYLDQASCVADYQTPEEYIDCLCPLYDKYPEVKSALACSQGAGEKYQACVKSAACDEDKAGACLNDLIAATQDCPPPPVGFSEEAQACASEL